MSDQANDTPNALRCDVTGLAMSRRGLVSAGAAAGLGLMANAAQAQSRATIKAGMVDGSSANPGPRTAC